jgi:hypothetical protein
MNFNQMKYLLVHILGDLTVTGTPVDVLTEFPPGKRLPAITMNSIGGQGHIETLVHKKMNYLPLDHPWHDPQAPETLYHIEDVYVDVFKGRMLLHVWSESNEERDMLVDEVVAKILKNKNNHFRDDLHVQLINIGSTTDLDQFDSFPPLYHTTMELDFIYYMIHSVEVTPLCDIHPRN